MSDVLCPENLERRSRGVKALGRWWWRGWVSAEVVVGCRGSGSVVVARVGSGRGGRGVSRLWVGGGGAGGFRSRWSWGVEALGRWWWRGWVPVEVVVGCRGSGSVVVARVGSGRGGRGVSRLWVGGGGAGGFRSRWSWGVEALGRWWWRGWVPVEVVVGCRGSGSVVVARVGSGRGGRGVSRLWVGGGGAGGFRSRWSWGVEALGRWWWRGWVPVEVVVGCRGSGSVVVARVGSGRGGRGVSRLWVGGGGAGGFRLRWSWGVEALGRWRLCGWVPAEVVARCQGAGSVAVARTDPAEAVAVIRSGVVPVGRTRMISAATGAARWVRRVRRRPRAPYIGSKP